jgi:hypothetical protein
MGPSFVAGVEVKSQQANVFVRKDRHRLMGYRRTRFTSSCSTAKLFPSYSSNIFVDLSMDRLLHVGVNRNHTMVQVRMLPHQDLWIPSHGNKNGINAAR